MTGTLVPGLVLLLLVIAAPALPQEELAAAKDLYVAAKYEEALTALDRLKDAKPPRETALVIEEYRAMCLLALNRKAEAEQAIEGVAEIDPFFQPAEDDAAPWVRTAFKEARRKVLPAAVQRLYNRGKQAYDRKSMAEATATFKRVLALLDDPDVALDKSGLSDLRIVTQGFLDLAQAAEAAEASAKPAAGDGGQPPLPAVGDGNRPPAPGSQRQSPAPTGGAPASSPAARTGTGSGAASGPASRAKDASNRLPAVEEAPAYDATATDVVPPVAIRRDVPSWPFATRATPGTAVVVELIVRENGGVESAVIRQSGGKYYDQLVVQAAKNWLYRPATKGGQPVRYRLMVRVVQGSGTSDQPDSAEW